MKENLVKAALMDKIVAALNDKKFKTLTVTPIEGGRTNSVFTFSVTVSDERAPRIFEVKLTEKL